MEYKEDQLTEWKTEKPTINGIYQTKSGVFKTIGYQKFKDGYWYEWCMTPEDAELSKHIVSECYQNDEWRGLIYNPSKPKKQGNKRKTMYVVMARGSVLSYPMACFTSKLSAEDYIKNCRVFGYKPDWMRIEKIRFRTPEA